MLSPFPSLSPQQLVSHTKDSNQRKRRRHRKGKWTKTMAILATKTVANGGICSGASSASNYVPLTDGLTAKEAQTVWIPRLDDNAFIGKNLMANLARWWMGSGSVKGNFNPVRTILLSVMHSLFGSFGNNNLDADEEDALNNYDEILIEEDTEDVCMGSPRENRRNIIGNNKDDNKDNNKICLRIQGADLRRFKKDKKRPHLTTALPWYKRQMLKQECIEVGWVSIPSHLLLYTMHHWSCRGYTESSLI
jgi:hypothetical protein